MKWLCHSEGWRVTEAALFINLGPTSAFHLISLRQESWLTSLLIIVRFGLRWKGAMNFPSVLQEEWNLHFPGICDFHNLNFFLKKKKNVFSFSRADSDPGATVTVSVQSECRVSSVLCGFLCLELSGRHCNYCTHNTHTHTHRCRAFLTEAECGL